MPPSEAIDRDVTAAFVCVADVKFKVAVVMGDDIHFDIDDRPLPIGSHLSHIATGIKVLSALQMVLLLAELVATYAGSPSEAWIHGLVRGPHKVCRPFQRAFAGAWTTVLVAGGEMGTEIDGGIGEDSADETILNAERSTLSRVGQNGMGVNDTGLLQQKQRKQGCGEDDIKS